MQPAGDSLEAGRREAKFLGSSFVAHRRWTERLAGSRASYLYLVARRHKRLSRVTKQWPCPVTVVVIFRMWTGPTQTHF